MANKKITDLVEITSAADVDVLAIVDVSADTTNKIKIDNLPVSAPVQTALDAKQETLVSGTNIKTINSTSLLGSGDIAISANPAGTSGQIQFNDSSAFGADSNLFWDNTNKRLGVGTSTPTAPMHINSSQTLIMSINRSDRQIVKLAGDGNDGAIVFVGSLDNQFAVGTKGNDFKIYDGSYLGGGNLRFSILSDGKTAIGEHTPTAKLDIKGSGSTSNTTSLLVQNSSGTELMKIDDFGNVILGSTSGAVNIVSGYNNRFIFNRLSFYGANTNIRGMASGGQGIIVSKNIGITDLYPTAIFAIDSTTQGFLPPRMTTTEKNAISSPASGLMVYDTDTNKLCCYNGSTWNDLF